MTRGPVQVEGEDSSAYGYSAAYRVGDTVYVSGVIGRGPDGKVPADQEDEYEAAFSTLADVLRAAGMSLADVVDLTTYHVDLAATVGTFMAVKARHIAAPFPAWTAVGVSALAARGGRVEIKAVAVAADGSSA